MEIKVWTPACLKFDFDNKLVWDEDGASVGAILHPYQSSSLQVINLENCPENKDFSEGGVYSWLSFVETKKNLEEATLVPTVISSGSTSGQASSATAAISGLSAASTSGSDLAFIVRKPPSKGDRVTVFKQDFPGAQGSVLPFQMEFMNSLTRQQLQQPNQTLPKRAKSKTMLPCSVCGKAFDRPSLLKRHLRTHTGEKPHICEVCKKGFSTSSSLNTHRRIHSGEKPHVCLECGKRFTASSNLYYHKMTHNKDKPHRCKVCNKTFPTPGDLKTHQFMHNGEWPFKCHLCNRGFTKASNIRSHLIAHFTMANIMATSNPPLNIGESGTLSPILSGFSHYQQLVQTASTASATSQQLTTSPNPPSMTTSPLALPVPLPTGNGSSGYPDFKVATLLSEANSNGGKTPSQPALRCPFCPRILPEVSLFRFHILTAHCGGGGRWSDGDLERNETSTS